ncbi:MAG: tetratricopeptide repeat protein [Mesorhizobium sp.]|nr:tetratricopeptide repeat protein [Mesorhizobium sp.]
MSTRIMLAAAAFALSFPLFAVPALSAGSGGGTETTQKCKEGEVWSQTENKCVPAKQGAVDDDSLYAGGRALALAGRYGEAINVLSLAANKNDPRILNYLGYAHRKAGRVEVGLGYYEEALRADPDYTLAREYMGEAYLSIGDIAAARGQLDEIEKRCGKGCAEFAELEKQIASFVKGG